MPTHPTETCSTHAHVVEHLALALGAAVAGLLIGWLAAPLLTDPGAGLLGSAAVPR